MLASSSRQLSSVQMFTMAHLELIDLSHNSIEVLPAEVRAMQHRRNLRSSEVALDISVRVQVGTMTELKKLYVDHNRRVASEAPTHPRPYTYATAVPIIYPHPHPPCPCA